MEVDGHNFDCSFGVRVRGAQLHDGRATRRLWVFALRAAAMARRQIEGGDTAPNVRLLALDGQTTFHLSDRIGQRPLVLVFGSYT